LHPLLAIDAGRYTGVQRFSFAIRFQAVVCHDGCFGGGSITAPFRPHPA
jgi:hypothetical protein